jgi:hypothetical protein
MHTHFKNAHIIKALISTDRILTLKSVSLDKFIHLGFLETCQYCSFIGKTKVE